MLPLATGTDTKHREIHLKIKQIRNQTKSRKNKGKVPKQNKEEFMNSPMDQSKSSIKEAEEEEIETMPEKEFRKLII